MIDDPFDAQNLNDKQGLPVLDLKACFRLGLLRSFCRHRQRDLLDEALSNMHTPSTLVLLSAVLTPALAETGQRQARMALEGIMGRQFQICKPVSPGPNLCERSCGPGYIVCIKLPTCYNPSAGEVCCSDGGEWPYRKEDPAAQIAE